MAAPQSRETRIYLALWRKAYQERGSGLPEVTLYCPNKSVCLSTRSGFYRAIKPYREAKILDMELQRAAEEFVLVTQELEDGRSSITLRERKSLINLEAQLASLGIEETALLSAEEVSARGMFEELTKGAEAEQSTPRSTPFYDREG